MCSLPLMDWNNSGAGNIKKTRRRGEWFRNRAGKMDFESYANLPVSHALSCRGEAILFPFDFFPPLPLMLGPGCWAKKYIVTKKKHDSMTTNPQTSSQLPPVSAHRMETGILGSRSRKLFSVLPRSSLKGMCARAGVHACLGQQPRGHPARRGRGEWGARVWGCAGPWGQDGWGSEGRDGSGGGSSRGSNVGVESYLGSVPTSCKGLQTRSSESPPEASWLLSHVQGKMKTAGTGTAEAEWPCLPADWGGSAICFDLNMPKGGFGTPGGLTSPAQGRWVPRVGCTGRGWLCRGSGTAHLPSCRLD